MDHFVRDSDVVGMVIGLAVGVVVCLRVPAILGRVACLERRLTCRLGPCDSVRLCVRPDKRYQRAVKSHAVVNGWRALSIAKNTETRLYRASGCLGQQPHLESR